MAISTTNSTVEVAYRTSSGAAIENGSQESDGRDYALLTATILDGDNDPVPNAQVRFEVDSSTPDGTARFVHGTAAPNRTLFASITGADGVATAELRSQSSAASPLTINVRAAEDDGRIDGIPIPTTATVGAQGTPDTTISTPTTVTTATTYQNTKFEALVDVRSDGVQFINCTFDVSTSSGSNCVRHVGAFNAIFDNCTFTGCTNDALIGYGFRANRCHFTDIGRTPIAVGVLDLSAETVVGGCRLERYGQSSAAPGISVAPGGRLRIRFNYIFGPHEDSPEAITGFSGREAITILNRRPNVSTGILIEYNWLLGGDDHVVRAESLDDGSPVANLRLLRNRVANPTQYANPNGELVRFATDTVAGLLTQGNIDHATAAPLSTDNTGGVGWYYPASFLSSTGSVTFGPDPGALAVLGTQFKVPGSAGPTADPIPRFHPFSYIREPIAVVDLRARFATGVIGAFHGGSDSETGDDAEAYLEGEGGVIVALGTQLDDFRDPEPTAVVYPPPLLSEPGAPENPVLQFAADDTFIQVREDTVVNLTIESSFELEADSTLTFALSGTATSGSDYTITNPATFSEGNTSVEIPVTVLQDATIEGDELVMIELVSASGAIVGERNMATIRIRNFADIGEPTPAPEATFLTQAVNVTEGDSSTQSVIVELSEAPVGTDATVTYSYSFVSLSSAELNDVSGGSITIPIGETQGTIQFSINDDTTVEQTEVALINLGSVTGGGTWAVDADEQCLIRVLDDDEDPVADIGWTVATEAIREGQTKPIVVMASQPVVGQVTVPFTETLTGVGFAADDYEIRDGVTQELITSPLVFESGQMTRVLELTILDDAVVEVTANLNIALGTATGNAVTNDAMDEIDVTVIDNDTSTTGSDGDLYGLVPERTTADLTQVDIDVFDDRYEIQENIPLGISASTVSTARPLQAAIRAARDIWLAKNTEPARSTLQADSGKFLEGSLVYIRVNGDLVDGVGNDQIQWGWDDGNAQSTYWNNYPIVRDLVIYGATGVDTDIIPWNRLRTDGNESIAGGAYAGRRQIAANIRFERLSIEGNVGGQTCFGSERRNDTSSDDFIFGAFKFYDTSFNNPRNAQPDDELGFGVKWTVRISSVRAAWDFRGVRWCRSGEHAGYIDFTQEHFYAIGCWNVGGYPRTMFQMTNRANLFPGAAQQGTAVFMRNVIRDNVAGPINEFDFEGGGGDITVVGYNGEIHLVENQHIGVSSTSGAARACYAIWADHQLRPDKGIHEFDVDGTGYINDTVFIRGPVIGFTDNGPNRELVGISSTRRVVIEGFDFRAGTLVRNQFGFDKCGTSSGQSIRIANGEPANGSGHGVEWDLHWPTWNGDPWTGSVSSYPGWNLSSSRIRSQRGRRLCNRGNASSFPLANHDLTTAEIDVFDGSITWGAESAKPVLSWPNSVIGFPRGGSNTFYLGNNESLRSIIEHTVTYSRSIENIAEASFTEGRNSTTSFDSGTGLGTMTFTYQDDYENVENDERPEFEIEQTGDQIDTSEPAVIRYTITDGGSTVDLGPHQVMDVFLYSSNLFATFQFDPQLYPGGTHTMSVSAGNDQTVDIVASGPTNMFELVRVDKDDGASTSDINAINYSGRVFNPGEVRRSIPIRNVASGTPGETVVIDITGVDVDGVTAGNVGTIDTLTITLTP